MSENGGTRTLSRIKQRLFYSPLIPRILHEIYENRRMLYRINDLERRVRSMQEALGRIESRQLENSKKEKLQDQEFRVYSQWGEDGIIQHLVNAVPIENKIFVEFGVESYEEANTRFLLINNNWSGLVLDCDGEHIERIRKSREYWLYNLKAAQAFITRDNINELFASNGIEGEIGLLSIDIDGMDYWIWRAIDRVRPAIVFVEYNHRFGADEAVAVPYKESFNRREEHHSLIYYGASLRALEHLGKEKGYDLVGCCSNGLNAFFVRGDLRPKNLPALSAHEAYAPGKFSEYHDQDGARKRITAEEEHELVMSLPLVRVEEL